MRQCIFGTKKGIAWVVALILLMAAGISWMERGRLSRWYYLRGLAKATPEEREGWIEPVLHMDAAAVPALLKFLGKDDTQACGNAQVALDRLVQQWGLDDPRSLALVAQLGDEFSQFSLSGKIHALKLAQAWMDQSQALPIPETISSRVIQLLGTTLEASDSELHLHALEVWESLLKRQKINPLPDGCKRLIAICLGDARPHVRVRAVQLAARVGQPFVREIVPLLHDSDATVRRAALHIVGLSEDMVGTDELLSLLHDPDKEVRQTCEAVLRMRNLSEQQIKLGRLVTDKRAAVRLQVLDLLYESPGLEPGAWLYRLGEDPNPAVRAAAVRAAGEQSDLDLSPFLQELADKDRSPTVSQLARYYLFHKKAQKEQ